MMQQFHCKYASDAVSRVFLQHEADWMDQLHDVLSRDGVWANRFVTQGLSSILDRAPCSHAAAGMGSVSNLPLQCATMAMEYCVAASQVSLA